jgi:hypothetical protein
MELFHIARRLDKSVLIWIEYGPNMYQPITNDVELRFACQMLEGEIESSMSQEDQEQHKRDLSDYAHTKEYEYMHRTRTRTSGKKRCSKITKNVVYEVTETENCDESVMDTDTLCELSLNDDCNK